MFPSCHRPLARAQPGTAFSAAKSLPTSEGIVETEVRLAEPRPEFADRNRVVPVERPQGKPGTECT